MYKVVLDGTLIEKEKRKELERCLELEYGFDNVRDWFDKKKIPKKFQHIITYCELNGRVIFDESKEDYDYIITIDDVTYKNNHRKNLIKEVEFNHDIEGLSSWFDRGKIPSQYSHRVSFMKKVDGIVCDYANLDFRYRIIIDGIEIKANVRRQFAQEVEQKFNVVDVENWFDKKRVPLKYKDRVQILEAFGEPIYELNPNAECRYSVKIDDRIFKSDYREEVISDIEKYYDITGVKHWFGNMKVPMIHQKMFDFVEINGEVVYSKESKEYKYYITIDDRVYGSDFRNELIPEVEEKENICGVKNWYIDKRIPYHLQDKYYIVKLNDETIYDNGLRKYRYSVIVDGIEYNANSKKELIELVEMELNISGVKVWYDRYRLPKAHHDMFKEVIIDGDLIHPRKKRGF